MPIESLKRIFVTALLLMVVAMGLCRYRLQ